VSSPGPDDRELEQLLSETAGLRQRYRASPEEPPVALDDAIRAAARREVHARPRLAGSPFSGSWRVPLSIAAVVLVSATLTVMLVERDAYRPRADVVAPVTSTPPEAARKAAEPPAPKIEQQTQESDAAERGKLKEAPRTYRESRPQSNAAEDRKADSAASDRLAGRLAPGQLEEKAANAQAPGLPAKQTAVAPATSPEPFPAQPPAAAPAPAKPAVQSAVPGFSEPPSTGAAASTLGTSSDEGTATKARQKTELSKDQTVLRDTPAAAGAVAPQERREGARAPAAPAAEAPAAQALGKKQQGAADTYSESAARPWEHDPAAWLKHIDMLRTAGQIDEAKASFEAFRKRYPDYQLPPGFVPPGS
jgi:hypothetical protein